MTALTFDIVECRPAAQTAAPGIVFRIRIAHDGPRIQAMALRCQVQIEPRGRQHSPDEQARLYELFGERSQWDRTLRSVLWAQPAITVNGFDGSTEVDLHVGCTYDFEVAAAKYFHAVRDGDVPLLFLFTGTMFRTRDGAMSIEPVAWDSETTYRMPAHVWQDAMDRFFPDAAWIQIRRSTFDALHALRGRRALISWDDVVAELLRLEAEAPKEQV